MIRAVAFCPAAPVLIPGIAQGAAPELDDLRAACRAAIAAADAPDRQWLILGPGTPARLLGPGSRGSLEGLGFPLEVGPGRLTGRTPELPLPLTVGAWLLEDAGTGEDAMAATVGEDPAIPSRWVADHDLSILAIGDGSARRGARAPGYLDERAPAFDAHIGRALATGDAAALAALDAALGADLLAAGVPVWRAVAVAATGREWDARLLHAGAPYGVAYFAAVWTSRG